MENFSGKEFTLDDLLENEDVIKFMSSAPKGKKVMKKKSSPKERATSEYECHQCDARVWEKGYGGQCSRKKVDGECMCQMHLNAVAKEGGWWLGVVTEPRPEELNHPNGKAHAWKITAEGEEVVKEKKSPKKSSPKTSGEKKKPGRPKGTKNKNKSKSADAEKDAEIAALQAKLASLGIGQEVTTKKITVDESELEHLNGWEAAQVRKAAAEGNAEVMAKIMESAKHKLIKLDEKQEEQVPDNASEATQAYKAGEGDYDDDGNKDITYEGVKYKVDRDGDVINPDDYSCIGSFDEDTGVISFHGEDEEEKHEAKK